MVLLLDRQDAYSMEGIVGLRAGGQLVDFALRGDILSGLRVTRPGRRWPG